MDPTALAPQHHMAKYRACKNAFEFEADLNKAAKVLGMQSVRQVVVALALQLVTLIMRRTPVDTGRARANWFLSEGAPLHKINNSAMPDDHSAVRLSGERPVYITNSLPYIVPLEYGHSKQAPFGMVRVALAELMARLNVGGKSA